MREVIERLSVAAGATAIGNILGDACERGLPFGSFGYVVVEPGVSERPCMVVRSGEFPPEWLMKRFPAILLAIERDLGGLMAALSERRAYDGYEKFPLSRYGNTELVQDHWRPIRCDQQLVAPLWHAGAPVGYFSVNRPRREPHFMAADLRLLDELRIHAERALERVAALGPGDLSQTLDALSQAFPYPAFLFDAGGTLRWMGDEGALRLGVAAARAGAGCLIRGNKALEGLSRFARLLAKDPAFDADQGLRVEGLLRRGERLVVRQFGESGQVLLLLALTPAMARQPGCAAITSLPRLGTVESKVARLAAEGYTVLNIAARLNVSEATVRTHLHRVYVKLGVHGRAELAFALLQGGG